MRLKNILLFFGILLVLSVIVQATYCCEKTTYGAFCQNEDEEKCDNSFRKAPTSCASSSFCREGCCFNSNEGTCLQNTPQKICEEKDGKWSSVADCDIAQCELGCCLIGDQAAFVTSTRCKRLSTLYGLQTNFRTDISNELSCIASIKASVKGACVFEKEFERTCLLTTQKACSDMSTENGTEFYEGHLCTDSNLSTNCAKQQKTTCVDGSDQVYYIDSCGNLANIYDSDKYANEDYWSVIKIPSESCGYDSANGNADSRTCGNCDFFAGSTCKEAETTNPVYGDNICKGLSCEYKGETYEHGETWCGVSGVNQEIIEFDTHILESLPVDEIREKIISQNLPGTRYFRLLCYNGEVLTEPCADYRQEICLQDEVEASTDSGVFRYAACIVNKWEDCLLQEESDDCENTDKRDCYWLNNSHFTQISETSSRSEIEIITGADGICVPKYAPGFKYWSDSSEENQEETCKVADRKCVIKYEKEYEDPLIGGMGGWDITKNEQCSSTGDGYDDWLADRNLISKAVGDCGMSENYLGYLGFYDEEDITDISERLDEDELSEELTATE